MSIEGAVWGALRTSDASSGDAYGYDLDDISRANPTGFDEKQMEMALAKLEVMVQTGALSQADFDAQKEVFHVRLAERGRRQEAIAAREAGKQFTLRTKAKVERAARNKAEAMRAAAEQEEQRRADYHSRQRAAAGAADALSEPLHRAQLLLEQPQRAAAAEARKLLRKGIPLARAAGRKDIELSSMRALAQCEERSGNLAVAEGIRYSKPMNFVSKMITLY